MPQRTYALNKSRSSAIRSALVSLDPAPVKLLGTTQLNIVVTIYAAIEFLVVANSSYLISFFYYRIFLKSWESDPKYIFEALLIAILVSLASLGFRSFVAIQRQARTTFLWRGVEAVAFAFSVFLSIIFIAKFTADYSRATLILQTFGVSIIIIITRAIFYSWLQTAIASNRIKARRVVLIGDISDSSMFADRLKTNGIQTVRFFNIFERRSRKTGITTSPEILAIISECRSLQPDDIIVLANNETMSAMFDVASALAELPMSIHIVPIDALNLLASSQITELGNLKTIQVSRPPLSAFDLCIKRTLDLILATIGLIVLSPLLLFVSIAIKLDSVGPVLFRQTRHGFNNEEIRIFKFRSMTSMEDGAQFKQAIAKDPRVTRIGQIIRRTNIDELPQLINVLRGEMSIVGPRPHPTALNALYNDLIMPFSRRHNVKPGITGWAQVNGFRGVTNTLDKMQRRIEYDLQYIDNWSLLFDIKIIMLTLFSRRAYSNAY